MTFWEALPQIADIGGLTLGFLLLVGVFFAILKLVMPAAKFIQDMMREQKRNYDELLAKTETIHARDVADERADRERLEKRLDQNEAEIGRMSDQIAARDKQIAEQSTQLTELTRLLNNMQSSNSKKDQTIEEMRRAIRALQNQVAELKASNDMLISERDDWKEKFQISEQQIALLQSGVDAIRKGDTDQLNAEKADKEAKGKAA